MPQMILFSNLEFCILKDTCVLKKKGEVVLTNFKLAVIILLKNKNSLKKKNQQIMHAILKYETFEILIGYSYF